MGGRKRRRLYPIVDKSLQYKFLALVFVYGMIIVLFIGVVLFVPDILDIMNEDLSLELRAKAADRMLALHFRIWPAVLALVCLLAIHSFRVFLRIAGPLYRFKQAFASVGEGDLGFRLKLRKKDYLHEEEKAFNKMLDGLQERLEMLSECLRKGMVSIEALEKTLTKKNLDSEEKRLLLEHGNSLKAMAGEMMRFQLNKSSESDEEERATGAPP
ncbi:MAG: hypothetical protein JRJ29_12455 [Deltaproteobacteria bacterium]|nr:hypothetical protein [Deltaproteobacteria bacterium]